MDESVVHLETKQWKGQWHHKGNWRYATYDNYVINLLYSILSQDKHI